MIEMSSRPPLMMPNASLRFDAGRTASGLSSYHWRRRPSNALELEEVVLLLEQFHRGPVDGAVAVDELGLLLVVLARNAVQTAVDPQLGEPVVVDLLEELLYRQVVAGFGGPDEVVVGDLEPVPCLDEPSRHRVDPLQRRHPVGLCRPGDLVAVLVGPREEEDVVALEPVPPRQCVGDDHRVGVPDVGHVVHVVDRRRDVEAAHRRSVPTTHRTPVRPGRPAARGGGRLARTRCGGLPHQLATWQAPCPVRST